MNKIRCSKCGKFISFKDIENKKVIIRLVTPDSEYTMEEYENLCRKCNKMDMSKYKEIRCEECLRIHYITNYKQKRYTVVYNNNNNNNISNDVVATQCFQCVNCGEFLFIN